MPTPRAMIQPKPARPNIRLDDFEQSQRECPSVVASTFWRGMRWALWLTVPLWVLMGVWVWWGWG